MQTSGPKRIEQIVIKTTTGTFTSHSLRLLKSRIKETRLLLLSHKHTTVSHRVVAARHWNSFLVCLCDLPICHTVPLQSHIHLPYLSPHSIPSFSHAKHSTYGSPLVSKCLRYRKNSYFGRTDYNYRAYLPCYFNFTIIFTSFPKKTATKNKLKDTQTQSKITL